MPLGQEIGKGNTAEIYLWEEEIILKLFYPQIPDFLVEQEFLASREVERLGLPVPKVYGTQKIEGRHGILYERIEGESFTKYLFGSPANVDKNAEEFAALHQTIHRIATEKLPSLKANLNRNIQMAEDLSTEQKIKIVKYLAQLPDGEQVCHMDFHPDNILLTSKGTILIDWMTAVSGNPFADVARTSMILKYAVMPDTIPEAIRDTIKMIRDQLESKYVQNYLHQTGANEKHVEQWYLPIMAARLCEDISGEEKEILLKEIQQRLMV